MAKEIQLTQGKVAIVDDKDYEYLSQFKWRVTHKSRKSSYAIRTDGTRTILMHREIMNAPSDMDVDHINGDGLCNLRSNLRLCSETQNGMNRGVPKNNTSGYKGVSWNKSRRKWQVAINVDKKTRFIGYYENIKEAAKSYDEAAKLYYGDFAKTNF